MRANYLAQIITLIGFFLGAILTMQAKGNSSVFMIGALLSIGSIVWYFKKGQDLKGWIGDDLETMRAELRAVDTALETGRQPNGTPLSAKERDELYRRQMELWEVLRQYSIEKNRL